MKLGDLVRRLTGARLVGDPSVEVGGITHDSRSAAPGLVFAALPGERAHGMDFLEEALGRGAIAVLSDRPAPRTVEIPWILTPSPRRHTALAAWALAGDPQDRLTLVGITGTNGKSTVADLVATIAGAAGRTVGVFGTLAYRIGTESVPAERTTPEATDLAPLLRRLVEAGGDLSVMEVSSHAIALERVAGLPFGVAVFTNLSRDHLDFHGDLESYFGTKRRLFDELLAPGGRRVLPVGCEWAARILETPREGDLLWGPGGDVEALEPAFSLEGTSFTLRHGDSTAAVDLPLVGAHNLDNALAAAAAALAAGLPFEAVAGGLRSARPLPGRLEPVPADLPFPVFVDYAHTPDGLRAVLTGLRQVTDRRIIVVFGAGGDRDPGKRGPMGEAAGRFAHRVIVTSDNPRSEDPAAIAGAVAAGVRAAGAEPVVELDRRRAIERALREAGVDSLVLVAGKGHESVQRIGSRTIPFSDREVIAELAGRVAC